LTFGLGIIIIQGVSSRKSVAGVNIIATYTSEMKIVFLCCRNYGRPTCMREDTFSSCPLHEQTKLSVMDGDIYHAGGLENELPRI
jgi:hypothetical protein